MRPFVRILRAAWIIGCLAAGLPAGSVGAQQIGDRSTTGTFGGAILLTPAGSHYRDATRLGRLIPEVPRLPFAEIIIQVRAFGEAYYESALAPKAFGVSEGFDPLGEFLKGLATAPDPPRVIAWLDLLAVANVNRPVPLAAAHVLSEHGDWLTLNVRSERVDAEGFQCLEPALAEVQAHLEQIVSELIAQYPIDGVLLDGLRYPGVAAEWGYHPGVLQAWRERTGRTDRPAPDDASWIEFRREGLNRLVERLVAASRNARPGVSVSVMGLSEGPAPTEPGGFAESLVAAGALQDWRAWIGQSQLDRVIVENFRAEGDVAEREAFDAWNHLAARIGRQTGAEVFAAVAGFRNISFDALMQMRRAREAGLAGAALAYYHAPIQDLGTRDPFFGALRATVLAPSAERLSTTQTAAAPSPEPPSPPVLELPPPPEPPVPPAVETARGEMVPETTTPTTDTLAVAPPPGIEELLRASTRGLEGTRGRRLLQPSEAALEYLRRKFPNLF